MRNSILLAFPFRGFRSLKSKFVKLLVLKQGLEGSPEAVACRKREGQALRRSLKKLLPRHPKAAADSRLKVLFKGLCYKVNLEMSQLLECLPTVEKT